MKAVDLLSEIFGDNGTFIKIALLNVFERRSINSASEWVIGEQICRISVQRVLKDTTAYECH